MRRARAGVRGMLLALAAGWPADALAQGCAMCRTAFEGQTDPTTQAFNTSALFLMAAPYTLVALAAVGIYLATRRGAHDEERDDRTIDGRLLRPMEKETVL
jgi:hypothetical protein